MKNKKVSAANKNVAAPNKYLQPFARKQWEIVGAQEDRAERNSMQIKTKGYTEFFYRFGKSFLGIFGLITLVTIILCAFIIPYTTQDPTIANINNKYQQVFSTGHLLGTDEIGRDIWALLWHGLRFSILLAIAATFIDIFLGVLIGILMGYFEKFDRFMQQIIKVLANLPVILVMMITMLIFKPSFWIMVLSLSITGWIGMSNQMRAQVKRAKNFEWVTASKILGTPSRKIIKNFLPVIIPMLITQLVATIPGAILSETALAVIGLSMPNVPTLGNMIASGAEIVTIFPRYVLIPSFTLILITSSLQFIGNATQYALRRQR